MNRETWVILYLSISLLVVQVLWMRDAKAEAYQRGRNEVLEVMAEINYEAIPYTVVPKKGPLK